MKIVKVNWRGYDAIEMFAGDYVALMIPCLGANMVKLTNVKKGVDILRTPTEDEMEFFASRPQLFGLPLLFPPNRIEDGTYTYNSIKYQYPITIPAQNNYHHGIIKSQVFTVTTTNIAKGYVEVEASFFSNEFNNEIYVDFPHNFECKMYFRLSANGLTHRVTFVNNGNNEMPLGVGYHTPIMIPFTQGSTPADYTMQLSVGAKWELNERTLPTGNILSLDAEIAKMRTGEFSPVGKSFEVALVAEPIKIDGRDFNGAIFKDNAKNISVFYEVGKEYGHWTFWNNGGEVNWACAEPQTWAINAPNLKLPKEKSGFQTVAPGASWSAESKIYIK